MQGDDQHQNKDQQGQGQEQLQSPPKRRQQMVDVEDPRQHVSSEAGIIRKGTSLKSVVVESLVHRGPFTPSDQSWRTSVTANLLTVKSLSAWAPEDLVSSAE